MNRSSLKWFWLFILLMGVVTLMTFLSSIIFEPYTTLVIFIWTFCVITLFIIWQLIMAYRKISQDNQTTKRRQKPCPHCDALIEKTDQICPYCKTKLNSP